MGDYRREYILQGCNSWFPLTFLSSSFERDRTPCKVAPFRQTEKTHLEVIIHFFGSWERDG